MDRIYAEVGTEVILRGHSEDPDLGTRLKNRKANITKLDEFDYRYCVVGVIGSGERWWWPIQDMILATDEPLLRK